MGAELFCSSRFNAPYVILPNKSLFLFTSASFVRFIGRIKDQLCLQLKNDRKFAIFKLQLIISNLHSIELLFVATVTNVPVSLCDDCLLARTLSRTCPQGSEPRAKRALCVPRNNSSKARRNRLCKRP